MIIIFPRLFGSFVELNGVDVRPNFTCTLICMHNLLFIVAHGIVSACAYKIVCIHVDVCEWMNVYECVCADATSLSMCDASETRQSRKRLPKIFAKCVLRLTCKFCFVNSLVRDYWIRMWAMLLMCVRARIRAYSRAFRRDNIVRTLL